MEAQSAAQLLPEQRMCLAEFRNDVRDVFADPASVAAATSTLSEAFRRGTRQAWSLAVTTIAELLALPAIDASVCARRRLACFVDENADLLRPSR